MKLPDGKVWKNVTIPEKAKVAETLDEFRAAHKYNFLDDNVRAFNAEVPIFVQWDDHEVTNNWSPSKQLPAAYKERDITLLAARAARAFHEMYPMRESIVEPGRVYRTLSYGPHLDVFMLDERSYRGPNGPNLQTTYGPDSYFLGPDQLAWLKRALLNSRATWKVIASDMPLSIVVYDDAPNKKGSEAFAQGDGPPRGRELEIADILRFIKTSGVANTVWLTADVHYAAAHYYNPDKAQFQDFEPFWEFVSGPLHAGTFGPNELDNTFGPEVKFIKAPGPRQAEPAAVGRHAVLRSRQDRRRHRTDDGDLARSRRRRAVVDDARPEAGVRGPGCKTSKTTPCTVGVVTGYLDLARRISRTIRRVQEGSVATPVPGIVETDLKGSALTPLIAATGSACQQRLQRVGRIGFGQPRLAA